MAQHQGCPPVMVLQFLVLGITAKPALRCWRQAAEFAQQTFRDFLSSDLSSARNWSPKEKNCSTLVLFFQSPPLCLVVYLMRQHWSFGADIAMSDGGWSGNGSVKCNLRNQGASLVAQWLRICLPMQGTRVRALVWEDPTCRGATGSVSHNY